MHLTTPMGTLTLDVPYSWVPYQISNPAVAPPKPSNVIVKHHSQQLATQLSRRSVSLIKMHVFHYMCVLWFGPAGLIQGRKGLQLLIKDNSEEGLSALLCRHWQPFSRLHIPYHTYLQQKHLCLRECVRKLTPYHKGFKDDWHELC